MASSLMDLEIEKLMTIRVTSVSKKSERLFQSPSAIYVITQEDIRRSGAINIAEALRMAPGLQVARVGQIHWAVTSRGFNGQFANKLLVLIDGRSVFTPLTSGVHWSRQDTMLEDIERIEVIRGPGGTIWGANAVNGVINIITKNAADTQGVLVTAGGGNEERGIGGIRYGGAIGESTHIRGYVKYNDRNGLKFLDGDDSDESWKNKRGGFRLDSQLSQTSSFMLQADVYSIDTHGAEQTRSGIEYIDTYGTGSDIIGSWNRSLPDGSEMTFQVYFDRTARGGTDSVEDIDTYDLDFYHHFSPDERNNLSWGIGYRIVKFDNVIGDNMFYNRPKRTDDLFSAFMQDKIALLPDVLYWTIGLKFESNDYTGSEYEPSTRLLWNVSEKSVLWAAVSRATSTPSRADSDMGFDFGSFALKPSPELKCEEVLAYELGYRAQPSDRLSLDMTGFINHHDKLHTTELTLEGEQRVFYEGNKASAESYGVEISASFRPTGSLILFAGYTFLSLQINQDQDSYDDWIEPGFEGNYPKNQAHLRAYLNLPHKMEFDTSVFYVDRLSFYDINAYTRVDARLGWSPSDSFSLSLAGQNIFGGSHQEMEGGYIVPMEIERSVYLKATWRS